VLAAYPGKEVKKGLTDLYRKVEKHLSEEENLLQVSNRNLFSHLYCRKGSPNCLQEGLCAVQGLKTESQIAA
jgi:hypothetical protein